MRLVDAGVADRHRDRARVGRRRLEPANCTQPPLAISPRIGARSSRKPPSGHPLGERDRWRRGDPPQQFGRKLTLVDLEHRQAGELVVLRGEDRLIVVVLTSSEELRDVNQAYELGANSFMVKPMDFENAVQLSEMIQKYWLHKNRFPEAERQPPIPHNLSQDTGSNAEK